jgi:hypothetical protein
MFKKYKLGTKPKYQICNQPYKRKMSLSNNVIKCIILVKNALKEK